MYKHVVPALACVTLFALGPAPVLAADTAETAKTPASVQTDPAVIKDLAAPKQKISADPTQKETDAALEQAQQAYDNGDYIETFIIVEPLAKLNHPYAEYLLSLMYEFGHGVQQDSEKAMDYLVRSASQGYAAAQEHLGRIHMASQKGYDSALGWFNKAADQGYALAYSALGEMYLHGYGVSKNTDTALAYFQKAALNGDAKACFRLGTLYKTGEGVSANRTQALFWFKKGAEMGNKDCAAAAAELEKQPSAS